MNWYPQLTDAPGAPDTRNAIAAKCPGTYGPVADRAPHAASQTDTGHVSIAWLGAVDRTG